MGELTSPVGSLAAAISALLLVLGFRLARPERGREWAALLAYAAALVLQLLGARGVLAGGSGSPGTWARIGGALLLLAGLLAAGRAARARRPARDGIGAAVAPSARGRVPNPVYAALAVALVGQLLRGPSAAGAVAVAAATILLGWAALTSAAGPRRA